MKQLLPLLLLLVSTAAFCQNNDPCVVGKKQFAQINTTANAQLITGTSGRKISICSIDVVAAAATNVAIVEGTGSTCGTNTAGLFGGSTAATGWNFAANGGISKGNGGASIMRVATAADNVCILVSAANQISGSIAYVDEP